MKFFKKNTGLWLLILINIVGVFGFKIDELRLMFEMMTPYNQLFTLLICFYYLPKKRFFSLFILLFTIGLGIEILGVQTKSIFGNYNYINSILGLQVLNVPIAIGFNWFILTIGTRACVNRFTSNLLLQILYSSLLMVGIDFLIEPIAIEYKFWFWENNFIPTQNYFMWFVISISMQAIITRNSAMIPYYLGLSIITSQIIFFVGSLIL